MPESAPLAALTATDAIEVSGDPAQSVLICCERAKAWLAQCLADDAIEAIVETKSQAEAIRVYTLQKELGKDAELAATEIVRRAERCIGLAIRKGQAEGRIAKRGDVGARGGEAGSARGADLAKPSEIASETDRKAAYRMTDSITDAQFDEAIETAKAEKNLSRANVKRKLKGEPGVDVSARIAELAAAGHHSSQIAEELGISRKVVMTRSKEFGIDLPADRVLGRLRHRDQTRILREFVATLEALVPSCEQIDPSAIDHALLRDYSAGLTDALKELRKLDRRLRKELTNGDG